MIRSKKKYVIYAVIAAVILLVAAFLVNEFWPRKPFADLKQENVASVDVTFGAYPDYQISNDDQEKVVSILQSVTITGRSHFYQTVNKELDGKTYIEQFTLHLDSNQTMTVTPDYPFLIIDGTAYHCKDQTALEELTAVYTPYINLIKQKN